ncbi:hypothetical protein SAMIE_1019160 [Sphingobium amiense]|uniref:Isoquinoline 1-oxidoreductase subunit n=1 Tax=Sphingobium amiense TaxID=135719 RepID=A0A494WCV7_9SPHN|nr:Isoquinoline 1-oxidoreductase subunit [Sphingobium amiense]BBD98415.1 hypothetical protein SAMIE_1019160 [Sphingobium amiense]
MKRRHFALLLLAGGVAAVAGGRAATRADAVLPTSLRPASDFAAIADPAQRSLALFGEVGKVLQHPRCMNCHPATDRPTQTDAMRPHMPGVVGAEGGIGAPGLHCNACHQQENYDVAGVPGNPKWALAPAEMAWQGKTIGEICRQIKDPERNGGRDMAALQEHMATDELVGWGWHPGGDRTPVPGTQAQFGILFKAWVDSGAHCPA